MTQTVTTVKKPRSFISRAENLMTNIQVFLYRLSGGTVAGKFSGAPVLLLTTTGRKTGKKRTKPLIYLQNNDQAILVASHGGAPTHPIWWLNMQKDPHVEIQIKRTVQQVVAREATPAERETLWPKMVALYSDYANYQQRTTRTIPVVILEQAH